MVNFTKNPSSPKIRQINFFVFFLLKTRKKKVIKLWDYFFTQLANI